MIRKQPVPAKAGVADFSDEIMLKIKDMRARSTGADRALGTLIKLRPAHLFAPSSGGAYAIMILGVAAAAFQLTPDAASRGPRFGVHRSEIPS